MEERELNQKICKAAAGDRTATAQLLVEFGQRLADRIGSKMRTNKYPEITADDVLQEVYVDIFKGISSFDSAGETPFLAWLYRVADNRFNQAMRDRGRKKRGGHVWHADGGKSSVMRLIGDIGDDANETPSHYFAGKEAVQAVEVCVAALPENQQEAIKSYYLEEKQLDEIANQMGTTKNALRGLIFRARKTMRTMMGSSSIWFTKKS